MANCYKLLTTILNKDKILNPTLDADKIRAGLQLKARDEFRKQYPDGKVPINPQEWLTTPGGQVIQRWNRNREATSMDAFLAEFCVILHTPGYWTWNPAKNPDAYSILDGDQKVGECQALARAFRVLATCGNGLGLTFREGEVGEPTRPGGWYEGRHAKGFISNHPLAGILNLLPNVYPPGDEFPKPDSTLAQLYFWANHKVVPYGGKFYDPSYHNIYDKLEDMSVYHVCSDSLSKTDANEILKIETSNGMPMWMIEFSVKNSQFLRPDPARKSNLYMGPYREYDHAKAVLARLP